jgi:HEPN domain-containing protein
MAAGESAAWVYHDWNSGQPRKLVAEELVRVEMASAEGKPTAEGFWKHADISYLACRLLFLAGEATHHAALYMAAQTVEKYLKAILLAQATWKTHTEPDKKVDYKRIRAALGKHDLRRLAELVRGVFEEPEFIAFCEILDPFEIAGRYDDGHLYAGWAYSINVLSVLDRFVALCRKELASLGLSRPAEQDPVWQILVQDTTGNPFMSAGSEAVWHRNRLLRDILAAGRSDGS